MGVGSAMPAIRPATPDDIPVLETLIERSVRTLQAGDYSPAQIDGALGTVFGVDRQLIADGAYLVAETGGRIVGCGGWSRRRTLFGAHEFVERDDSLLDPRTEPARIRAFFVDPDFARRGIGAAILAACEDAARAWGFTRLELAATLTGEPLYARHGYVAVERTDTPLTNGALLPIVRMVKPAP